MYPAIHNFVLISLNRFVFPLQSLREKICSFLTHKNLQIAQLQPEQNALKVTKEMTSNWQTHSEAEKTRVILAVVQQQP